MIRVRLRPEPPEFDARVRQPGRKWLASHPNGRPRDYWTRCKVALAEAFEHRCGYLAIRLHSSGEVDHFVSCDEDRASAYEWSNYRYCDSQLNKRKSKLVAARLLDPFEVEDGWFELSDPDLRLEVTALCPPELRQRARDTIRRLRLDDDDEIIKDRRYWVHDYESGVNLALIELEAPLVARMLRRRLISPRAETVPG